jgi:single-stranded-DNA-specific exonuclease
LAEEHGRPAFVWGTDGNGVYKGSCRSGGGASVVTLMRAVPEVFIEMGGHHVAGGFSVKEEHIFTFGERLVEAMAELGDSVQVREAISIDAELSLADVGAALVADLTRLSPFGAGNPKPLFVFRGVIPEQVEVFGKSKEHTKLIFSTPHGRLEAIAFFRLPEQFEKVPQTERPVTLIAHVEQSFFMGRQQTRLRIVEVL